MPVQDLKHGSPMTPAIRMLKAAKVNYIEHLYVWEEHGGTSQIAKVLNVDEHKVIKTLIMETDAKKPFVILMHGDNSVSTKEMARVLKVKSVSPCTPEQADKNSGYHVGGTSPFATRRQMPVYVEASILELDKIYINGGYRGFCLEMDPEVITRLLNATPVNVAI
ncbi:MAG: Cys-tRNA(Pro) deacylase [Victivallales bacterium]|nr:Cys-tRNA(Pro) deacylase [Victivallales bacterium]